MFQRESIKKWEKSSTISVVRNWDIFQANLNVGGIEKKTKTLEQEHKKPVVKRRDADGVWETVRSWFGKKYYEVTYETVKKQIHIDVGTNMEDYMERLEPVVTKAVTEFVSDALLQIEKAYLRTTGTVC